MEWTEGHVWVLKDVVIPSDSSTFMYKYVITEGGKAPTWERGYNRIADLLLLHLE